MASFASLLPLGWLFPIGWLGAWLSNQVRTGSMGLAWLFLPSTFATFLWIWITTRTQANLLLASCAFDVVYTLAYAIGFWALGSHATPIQLGGVALGIVSVVLMNL